MNFYIEPEVCGGLLESSLIDTSVHPSIVKELHFQFDGWLGDGLIECFPCFLILDTLLKDLEQIGCTGFKVDKFVEVQSETFKVLQPQVSLPDFLWLKIIGKAGFDGFGISTDNRLVISEKVRDLLESGNYINNSDIEPFV